MFRPKVRSPSITSQESYSAVIITDLVAEVPVSTETEEIVKSTKDVTNMAYDGHLDGEVTNPATEPPSSRTNSSGAISRGVILNAVQFGQNDSKSKGNEKSIQLSASLPAPVATPQKDPEPKGFKEMSLPRKIAFVFSFLPSVLFVLCFAIILPCNVPPPCVEETWVKIFNETEATSGLEISESVFFTALKDGKGVILEMEKSKGESKIMDLDIKPSTYLKCGKIMNKDRIDCLIMDETGKIYVFNETHSNLVDSRGHNQFSNPLILTGCNDEMDDVVIVISNTLIEVLHGGRFAISDCDSPPMKLMAWTINNSPNIVFICEKDGKDKLVRVPESVWCPSMKKSQAKPIVLESTDQNLLKKSTLQPVEDGLVLWAGSEVAMIRPNGTYIWKVHNISHPEENRFILYGNFYGSKKQVALFSSKLSSGLEATLLDPEDGSFIKSISHFNTEVTEMIPVEGKERDLVLILLRKAKKTIVTAALNQINNMATTIVNSVSNADLNHPGQSDLSEELALIDLEGNIDSIRVIRNNGDYKSSVKATSDKKTGILSIYLLSNSINIGRINTEVRHIDVRNWDKSLKSKCKI